MALLQLEKGDKNKILRAQSVQLKKVNKKKMGKFFDDMRETMFKTNGIGLAAPQVGINERAVVCFFNNGTANELIVEMVNPEILDHGKEMDIEEEGCLSLPGKFAKVERYKSLTVKYMDRKGAEHILKLDGLNARIVQHEVDHLNGKLYIDRVKDS